MEKVIEIMTLDNYKIRVLFADNFNAVISIKPFITTGISEKLDAFTFLNLKESFKKSKLMILAELYGKTDLTFVQTI